MESLNRFRSSTAVLVALLVVCSGAATATAAAGATGPATAAPSTDAPVTAPADNDTVEQADEVYVKDGGDAVLVYEQDGDGEDSTSTASGHVGLNVSEGLMHVLVRDDLEEETNVTGDAQFVLTPSSLAGNGSFEAPRPEELEDLNVNVSAQRTETDASARASLEMTYTDDGEYSTTSRVESASTQGEVSVTADAFATSGSAQATYSEDLGTLQHREYTLEEGTDQYRLQASEEYYVSSYFAQQWDTEENATRTLRSQYATIAESLGGEAQVTVESYDFTETAEGRNKLDIEYQIVYSNVDEALGDRVAQSLTNAEDADVSEETAEAVGDGVAALEVDRVHAAVDAEGESMQATWDVELSNYDPLVRASLDLAAEQSEDENVTEQVERARKSYAAAQAAELSQTLSWDASVSSPSEDTVEVSASMQYDTENYEAYVNELEARDLPTGGSVTFEATARTDGEDVVGEMNLTVEREELVDRTLDNVLESASQSEAADTANTQRFVRAFQRSEFEKAKMNVDVAEDEVTFQAGASFENMSSFQAVMQEEFGGQLSGIYADLDEGSKAYVYVDGAFSANATESEVREHEAVGEDTDVNLPGEWNASEKEFPTMDDEEARNYLGIEEPEGNATGDGEGAGGLPGFGAPVAFAALALVAAGLLARRVEE